MTDPQRCRYGDHECLALCLALRRERALREALETLVTYEDDDRVANTAARALAATDSAKGEP